MAVIPYTQIPDERLAEDEQLSALVGRIALVNAESVASMRSGGGWAAGSGLSPPQGSTNASRAWTIPGEWVAAAWIVLWSGGGRTARVEVVAGSDGDPVLMRLSSAGEPVSVTTSGIYSLTADLGPRTGWVVLEIQISSTYTEDEESGSISGQSRDDVLQLSGGGGGGGGGLSLPYPSVLTLDSGRARQVLTVADLGSDDYQIHPAERGDLTSLSWTSRGVSVIEIQAGYGWIEPVAESTARPTPGALTRVQTARRVARLGQSAFGRSRRCARAGQPTFSLATRWYGLINGDGTWQTVEKILCDEPEGESVEIGICWACSDPSVLVQWRVLDDSGTVAETSGRGRLPRAYLYADERGGSLASWRLTSPIPDGGWLGVGELAGTVQGGSNSALVWTTLRAYGVTWGPSQSITLQAQSPDGSTVYVWAVAVAPVRDVPSIPTVVRGERVTEESAQVLRASDFGYRQIRRDFVSRDNLGSSATLAGVLRTSPIPELIGWGVETLAEDVTITVTILETDGVTVVDTATIVAGAAGRYQVERDPVLDGDTTYIYAAALSAPGGSPAWDAIRIYETPIPEPVEVLVIPFGPGQTFPTYADLPSDSPEGAWAVDVRTPGATYRAHAKFGRTWWIPSVAYGDGTGFVLLAACDGSEANVGELNARGFAVVATIGAGTITYQPVGGVDSIRLAVTTAGGSAFLQTADYAGAPTNYDSDTDTWIVHQRETVSGSGANGLARFALATQSWQVRYGRRLSAPTQDRLFRDSNINLNATTNYLSGVTEFSADADTDTVELIRRTQPAGTVGAGGDRVETRRSGSGYLSVIGPTQGGGPSWISFVGVQSSSGSAASMDVRAFLVVVRP